MKHIEKIGDIFVKRGDLYTCAGVNGSKALVIKTMARGSDGLITAGPRVSSQIYIGARIAKSLNIPFRCHIPNGKVTPEMADVLDHGGTIIQHKAGYNNVLTARANEDAKGRKGWVNIPLWLRGPATVKILRGEVGVLPKAVKRVVVAAGSGMALAAVLYGLRDTGQAVPVLGVCVGADPVKTLNTFGPFGWRDQCTLVTPESDYKKPLSNITLGNIKLDPRYEAKCLEYIKSGDLFWIAGYGIHHGKD